MFVPTWARQFTEKAIHNHLLKSKEPLSLWSVLSTDSTHRGWPGIIFFPSFNSCTWGPLTVDCWWCGWGLCDTEVEQTKEWWGKEIGWLCHWVQGAIIQQMEDLQWNTYQGVSSYRWWKKLCCIVKLSYIWSNSW